MSTLNDNLKTWSDLADQASAPLSTLAKGLESLGSEFAETQKANLDALLSEAASNGDALLNVKNINEAVATQRELVNSWSELLAKQSTEFGTQITEGASKVADLQAEAGREALDVLAKATDQLIASTGTAVDQYLNQVESALSWMLKTANATKAS